MSRSGKDISIKEEDIRCECGCLVAKLLKIGIELKCRRCKRFAVIPFSDFKDGNDARTYTLA